MITVQAYSNDGIRQDIDIIELPDFCPLCHSAVEPIYQKLVSILEGFYPRVELVFQCPRKKCGSFFIARFTKVSLYSSSYRHRESVPFEPFDVTFPNCIEKISPDYCAIANQAQKTEHLGWNLVAGPGYRKSLEFLVKDYLSYTKPENSEEIKRMPLGSCIAKYVENEKVRAMATRATWVGNDETHYIRKWTDKDLEDLKRLIQLTVLWIEMEATTDGIIKDMPEGKP
jgi:hypothetical protein